MAAQISPDLIYDFLSSARVFARAVRDVVEGAVLRLMVYYILSAMQLITFPFIVFVLQDLKISLVIYFAMQMHTLLTNSVVKVPKVLKPFFKPSYIP